MPLVTFKRVAQYLAQGKNNTLNWNLTLISNLN